MLTPAFELRQDDDFLIIEIKAPYSKMSEAEIYFHEEEFKFYSKPYYLRLHLPGKVVENGLETAKYVSDNGVYVVHMPKQSPGQVFTGLDLLTKLLAPNQRTGPARPMIEVLENRSANNEEAPEVEDDWHVEQMPWTPRDEVSLLEGRKYGFDRQRTGVIARIKEEIPDLVDIADPEHKSVQEARQERFKTEECHFSAEHYLADRYEPAGVEQVLAYEAPWQKLPVQLDGDICPRYVLRCLLEIHGIFSHHDFRYILNDLYITDYAVWIQSICPKRLQSLADALKQVKVRKADLDLDIPELERGAKLAIAEAAVEEAGASGSVSMAMQALCISNPLASTSENTVTSTIVDRRKRHTDNDDDSTSSDDSSWSDDESDSSDSTSDSSSDSELDSDDDRIAPASASRREGAVADCDSVSATSNSDSDSDDGSSSEGLDQCLLFVKDAEPEKRR
ncbi:hypothetical protein HPB50_017302 [Hyalomma asiaticum]|uniref:Uncharacterized protein n=1 Tax=Hyalomma asiaticum TaxID=266040 RepID=A0ACB7RMN5_HYAAI|nr:hypothetical protein HPB50_017302 [Hyalomma asiaticum]